MRPIKVLILEEFSSKLVYCDLEYQLTTGQTKKHFRFGVRQRVVLTLLGGLLITLTLSSWLALSEQESNLLGRVNHSGQHIAKLLALGLANSVVGYDYHQIELFLREVVSEGDVGYVKVLSKKGNVMAEAKSPGADASKLRFFYSDIRQNDANIGKLEVGINISAVSKDMDEHKGAHIVRVIVVIALLLLVEYLVLSILVVRPLANISSAISESSGEGGVLTSSLHIVSDDEFGDIAKQFNAMKNSLNQAHSALQGKVEAAYVKLRYANEELYQKSKQLEKYNLGLKDQTLRDPLTGIFNRRKYQDMMDGLIKERLQNGEFFTFLLVDVDNFKAINDQYGHDNGDSVIRVVAKRIRNCLRGKDIVCRIGGEEFFVYCENSTTEGANAIAEKIRGEIQDNQFHLNDISLSVTVSVGGVLPETGDDHSALTPANLYRLADEALYASKNQGRNRVTIYRVTRSD